MCRFTITSSSRLGGAVKSSCASDPSIRFDALSLSPEAALNGPWTNSGPLSRGFGVGLGYRPRRPSVCCGGARPTVWAVDDKEDGRGEILWARSKWFRDAPGSIRRRLAGVPIENPISKRLAERRAVIRRR